MSLLGRAVRTWLSGRDGYATTIPGGVHPDQAPQGGAMPFATYQQVSRVPILEINGPTGTWVERVSFTIAAETRANAQTIATWIGNQIAAQVGPTTIGTLHLQQWRVEDESGQSELYGDGSDELARVAQLDIVGVYEGG